MSLLNSIALFLRKPFNAYLAIALLLLWGAIYVNESRQETIGVGNASFTVHYFYSPTCPHCAAQKPFNQGLRSGFPSIQIVEHDISIPAESRSLLIMAQERGIGPSQLGTPVTIVGAAAFIGFQSEETTGVLIRSEIVRCLGPSGCSNATKPIIETPKGLSKGVDLPLLGRTDLSTLSLPVLAAVLGLADGFNPCAMWVLVYLISLIMTLKDRTRFLWLIVGTFVFASGVLYFLFMTAWLNAFLFIGYVRIVSISIGLVALGAGLLSVKDFMENKVPVCEATDPEGKKRIAKTAKELFSSPLTAATLIGIVVLAFTVNSVEFLCSAAIPAAFTQVLALSNLPVFEHYLYISIYVLFFMLDDLLVFGAAAFTISNVSGEKYAHYCKAIAGVILLILGILLLFAPQMLV
jgi:hypothetical protein